MQQRERYTQDEDNALRQYAGKKTAEEIGMIIGRTRNSVHCRLKQIGVSGRLVGENHRCSKLSNLQVEMLVALQQAGFTSYDIHQAAFDHVTITTVRNVTELRTRQPETA